MFPLSVLLIFRHLFPIVLQHFQYSFGIINFSFLMIFSHFAESSRFTYNPNNHFPNTFFLYLKIKQFMPSSSVNAFVYSIFAGFFPSSLGSDNHSSNSSIAFLIVLFITIPALSPFYCSGLLIWFLHRSHKIFCIFYDPKNSLPAAACCFHFTILPAFFHLYFGKYGALITLINIPGF